MHLSFYGIQEWSVHAISHFGVYTPKQKHRPLCYSYAEDEINKPQLYFLENLDDEEVLKLTPNTKCAAPLILRVYRRPITVYIHKHHGERTQLKGEFGDAGSSNVI